MPLAGVSGENGTWMRAFQTGALGTFQSASGSSANSHSPSKEIHSARSN
jgi:hypothetical protein